MVRQSLYDVIVIGAGASGYACARAALSNNKTVLILDHASKSLQKVFVSGGGRCNFTNLEVSDQNYVSGKKGFCNFALERFSNQDFIALMKKYNLKFEKKNDTQLFAEKGSQAVIKMLEAETKNADKLFEIGIEKISKNKNFNVETNVGNFEGKNLVIATGGMSFSQLGASDFGYKIAKQFRHKVVPVRAGLVGLNFDSELLKSTANLKGVSLRVSVNCGDFSINDDILFTHFGLSGPAILQVSLYWQNGQEIIINFAPEIDIETFLKEKRDSSKGLRISSILNKIFPASLTQFFLQEKDIFVSEASNKTITEIAKKINSWTVVPSGSQGFKSAEITLGGVDVNEIDENTMESLKESGLFFVGEVLDVSGQLGGYNLQWAWSSGHLAGGSL